MVWLGILGGIIIIVSWLYETEEAIRRHKSMVDLRFAVAQIVGIVLLTAYAASIRDEIFFVINFVLTVIVAFELAYSLYVKKIHRRKR